MLVPLPARELISSQHYTHVDDYVMTQNYPTPNLNQQNNPECRPRIPKPKPKETNSCKGRLLAALGLGLEIFDAALCLNQLIREPGELLARRPSPIILN